MPTEIRRLIFTSTELALALSDFIRSGRPGIAPGTVVHAELRETETGLSVFANTQGAGGQAGQVRFEEAMVCAALISWCMENKVPIARRARKGVSLMKDGNSVALDLKLQTAITPAEATGAAG